MTIKDEILNLTKASLKSQMPAREGRTVTAILPGGIQTIAEALNLYSNPLAKGATINITYNDEEEEMSSPNYS